MMMMTWQMMHWAQVNPIPAPAVAPWAAFPPSSLPPSQFDYKTSWWCWCWEFSFQIIPRNTSIPVSKCQEKFPWNVIHISVPKNCRSNVWYDIETNLNANKKKMMASVVLMTMAGLPGRLPPNQLAIEDWRKKRGQMKRCHNFFYWVYIFAQMISSQEDLISGRETSVARKVLKAIKKQLQQQRQALQVLKIIIKEWWNGQLTSQYGRKWWKT